MREACIALKQWKQGEIFSVPVLDASITVSKTQGCVKLDRLNSDYDFIDGRAMLFGQ
jgi:hypothetical protein